MWIKIICVYICVYYILLLHLKISWEIGFPIFKEPLLLNGVYLGHLGHFVSQRLLFVSSTMLPFAKCTVLEDWCMSIVEWHDSVCVRDLTCIPVRPQYSPLPLLPLSLSLSAEVQALFASCLLSFTFWWLHAHLSYVATHLWCNASAPMCFLSLTTSKFHRDIQLFKFYRWSSKNKIPLSRVQS